ncbi:hypothetical protein B0A49_10044 [Cryomyces minteri]|uniref:FAS1 domain-containing protein n=1 Tax=Cryomyces minteri TaxID=331657 RepID=A0A4U0WZF0_9PEZI|nr:hypothetical protein B0A49_10044 [Cryomyces minteri]
MHLKKVSIAALLGAVGAQAQATTQSLNATLAGNNQTSQLATFLGMYPNLLSTLAGATNITILAPSNNAFSTLLNSSMGPMLAANPGLIQAVLQYHVLNGTYPASAVTSTPAFIPSLLTNQTYSNVTGGQRVECVTVGGNVTFYSGLLANASVVQPNLNFTGGVIHVIDHVLTLPVNISAAATAANLTALAGALNATSLLGPINAARDLTIFAPNNAAFQSIGSALANASVAQLVGILGYHVLNGTLGYSSMLSNGSSYQTMNGANITVTINNGSVFVNSAKVVTPDVLVANGVIHVIDNVLNPNATSATPSASATSGAPAFSGASSASGVPFTSGQAAPTSSIASGGVPAATSKAASSSTAGASSPIKTGAVGAAALFGAGAAFMNY